MTTTLSPAADRAVRNYLDDLGRMLDGAETRERIEVLADVREHVEASLAQEAATQGVAELDEDAVQAVLVRLGTPAAIAADALSGVDHSGVAVATTSVEPFLARTWLPWLIVGLMALSVVPFVGYLAVLVGLVLFWRSPLWGRRAKVAGTVAYLMPLIVLVAFLLPVGTAEANERMGDSILLPATYDVVWIFFVASPLWLVPVSVVLALIAGRQPQR